MDAKRTVLVINAQLLNRKLFCKILETEYTVFTVEDGWEALKFLQESQGKRKISAVLLEEMPGEKKYEVLKKIHEDSFLSMIPVIVTTQEPGEDGGLEALRHGANDFISYPYHPEIVELRLKNLIQAAEARAALDILKMDALTGLLTKDAFFHKVESMLKSGETGYCIVAADMERFKVFNDTYGEAEGDKLLRCIAEECRKAFGKEALIAHGYADQFYLFIKKDKKLEENLLQISNNVQNFLSSTKVIVKFGIYDINEDEYIVWSMCDRAALAIEVIKNQYDKVFYYYDDTIREKLIVEQKITSIMNQALAQHQFHVYYQPKFDAETESVVGAEALVRWIHPEYGFLSPGQFIPVFEKNGFITEMDKYVWEEVCIFLKKQKDNCKENIPISVNVSRKDIYSENLVEFFPKLIEKYDLDVRWLHLEVTESAYSDNPEQLIKVVTQLREKGFVIEMDDFGSGYSSLNALSEIPIDVLKLDMKFIQSGSLHKNSYNIIGSVINLAKWMNLLIVAEGVESKEQLERLRELKCNIIQGYYFARPMKETDFERLLEEREVQPVYDVDSYIQNSVKKNENQEETNFMLVVDDLALNRAILQDYFGEEYNIKNCDNGIAAWEFIQRNYKNITIIMLDLYMPGMDGFELLKLLKSDKQFSQIPVIITSQAGDELEEKAAGIQIDGFLSKPYLKEEALQLVADVLVNGIRNIRRGQVHFRERYYETIEASLDKLTGVLNQSAFEREVREFLRGEEEAVLILLRMIHFEDIKEEKLFPAVAELLKNNVRTYDLIGRMEENQFALFLKASISQDKLVSRMERLSRSLNSIHQDIGISFNLGVCPCLKEDYDYESLYENAKRALLIAGTKGENQYFICERTF